MAGIEEHPGVLKDMTAGTTKEICIRVRRRTSTGTEPVPLSSNHHFYITLAKDRDVATAPALELMLTPRDGDSDVYGMITGTQSLRMQGGYFYSIEWVTPGGTRKTIDRGIIKIMKPV